MNNKVITSTLIAASLACNLYAEGAEAAQASADALDNSFLSPAKKFSANSIADRFTFGSYGELHGRIGDGDDNIDLHRLVLLTDVKLTDRLKFVSEVEFEHALFDSESGASKGFKKELEQAYFEYRYNNSTTFNAGVQILPIGIVNPRHEPTTFHGVERPNVEKFIIPSTWRETSISAIKKFENGFELNTTLHAGLDTSRGSEGNIRGGRPANREYVHAPESYALTLAGRYNGIAGLELGGAVQYQADISSATAGDQNAFLFETHGIYRTGNFELRALAAYWKADDYNGLDVDGQWGAYIEPVYNFETPVGKAAAFVRFSRYDYLNGTDRKNVSEYNIGLNFWPTDETVIKVDYSNARSGGKNDETINLGLGYYF